MIIIIIIQQTQSKDNTLGKHGFFKRDTQLTATRQTRANRLELSSRRHIDRDQPTTILPFHAFFKFHAFSNSRIYRARHKLRPRRQNRPPLWIRERRINQTTHLIKVNYHGTKSVTTKKTRSPSPDPIVVVPPRTRSKAPEYASKVIRVFIKDDRVKEARFLHATRKSDGQLHIKTRRTLQMPRGRGALSPKFNVHNT